MFPSLPLRLSIFSYTLTSLLLPTLAQQVYNAEHNVTSLLGTWSSGSGNVRTGPGFANPLNFSFTYPTTTGISYSFTTGPVEGGDGYFEEAQYRFEGNSSRPTCITGVVIFQHGTYTLNPNGSMTLNPIPSDGRIQVQDMCAAQSNIIQQFNQTTLFSAWRIFRDTQRGEKLQLYRFDGAPLNPMYLVSPTPEMLPVQPLTPNVTTGQRGMIIAKQSAASTTIAGLGVESIIGLILVTLISGVGVLL